MDQSHVSAVGTQRLGSELIVAHGRRAALLYWIPTVLVVLNAGVGGVFDAIRASEAMAIFHHLGYPDYFATLLGTAKVLGAIALVASVPPTLREWAYAGLTFDVAAAIISIVAVGDPLASITVPVVFLGLTLASFVMWRKRSGFGPAR